MFLDLYYLNIKQWVVMFDPGAVTQIYPNTEKNNPKNAPKDST